jgi:hypothetical protein
MFRILIACTLLLGFGTGCWHNHHHRDRYDDDWRGHRHYDRWHDGHRHW